MHEDDNEGQGEAADDAAGQKYRCASEAMHLHGLSRFWARRRVRWVVYNATLPGRNVAMLIVQPKFTACVQRE
jgi:hypothetical protein